MGTLTANVPRLDSHCPHKLPTSCRLTAMPICCACQDVRAHSMTYSVYMDGIGFVQRGTRWDKYCWFCAEYWKNRVAAAGIEPPQSRVPERPDQADFLEKWFIFHKGSITIPTSSGSTHTIAIDIQDWGLVSPGILPQIPPSTVNELITKFGTESLSLLQEVVPVNLPEEGPTDTMPPHVSLDDALDGLMNDGDSEMPSPSQARANVGHLDITQLTQPRARRANVNNSTQLGARNRRYREHYGYTARPPIQQGNTRLQRTVQADGMTWNGGVAQPATAAARDNFASLNQSENVPPSRRNGSPDFYEFDTAQSAARETNRQRRRGRQAAVFGSREDVQRDDYTSPITQMFANAERHQRQLDQDRMHAEQLTRQEASVSAPGSATQPSRNNLGSHLADLLLVDSNNSEYFERDNRWNFPPRHRRMLDITNNNVYRNAYPDFYRQTPGIVSPPADPPTYDSIFDRAHTRPLAHGPPYLTGDFHNPAPVASQLSQTLDNPARPEPLSDEEMNVSIACNVCYVQKASVVLIPCGHMIMCQWCADVVVPLNGSGDNTFVRRRDGPRQCPKCRKHVSQRHKVHL
ncbi:hypothetical protein EJ05DRAFT_506894 [Pseudovirgaria hyperparasitica]|uniref:RING-type domain-containing protein n=1 Tax=Pseudovirgaria hyperparasitica TaxID=470096 RepID=A0A6A6WMA4_9PEZI|nr:uncharacterized protein EJ05DRAFT_506894 [Pseudovirgaria hyperparasitica]KAF2763283.1 hypothetical protein EJ05DRAFT_506894 [Pseudovirgaria hyperparasitica]